MGMYLLFGRYACDTASVVATAMPLRSHWKRTRERRSHDLRGAAMVPRDVEGWLTALRSASAFVATAIGLNVARRTSEARDWNRYVGEGIMN